MNKALKLIRVFHHIKQKDLADKLGVSPAYLCEIEKGRTQVSLATLEKYSEVFKLPISSILYFSETSDNEINKRKPISDKVFKMLEWIEDCKI